MEQKLPGALKVTIILLGILTLGTWFYWINYFTVGSVQVMGSDIYKAFEDSFPVADGWMSIAAVFGVIGVIKRKDWGLLCGLLAASSSIFLGLMDITFNINNSMYHISNLAMIFEIFINIFTLGTGIWVIIALWNYRSLFIQLNPSQSESNEKRGMWV